MAGEQSQIQGVPAGVTLEPVPQNSDANGISGVPAGVTLEAVPSQSQTQQPDLGRFQGYSELGQGFIKGAKETARTVVGAADSAANWINQKLGTSELDFPAHFLC
jgi:hypothetical protein